MPAVLDEEHGFRVNYEVFYFADTEDLETFKENIVEYCGPLTDPVARMRFEPSQEMHRYDYEGTPYFFLNDMNRRNFLADPGIYIKPIFKMMPPDSAEMDSAAAITKAPNES